MSASTRAGQRAAVRDLAAQEVSNRTIARQVGVSESTVRRWRAAESAPDALAVPVDAELREHLAVLCEAGLDTAAAVRMALGLIADAYEYAWDYGLCERGTAPEIRVRIKGDALPPGVTW